MVGTSRTVLNDLRLRFSYCFRYAHLVPPPLFFVPLEKLHRLNILTIVICLTATAQFTLHLICSNEQVMAAGCFFLGHKKMHYSLSEWRKPTGKLNWPFFQISN